MPHSGTLPIRWLFVTALWCLVIPGPAAGGDVIVFDTITILNRPVFVKVLTKDRLFSAGGQRVRIEKKGVILGRILTGGDGYGYFKTEFESPGIHEIAAQSDGERATGTILVVTPDRPLILLEIKVVSLQRSFIDTDPVAARDALESLSKTYGLVYLTGRFEVDVARQYIRANQYPPSVVIPYRGRETFRWMNDKGLKLSAAVGSPEFSDAAKETVERRFSFRRTASGETVKNWKELLSRLQ